MGSVLGYVIIGALGLILMIIIINVLKKIGKNSSKNSSNSSVNTSGKTGEQLYDFPDLNNGEEAFFLYILDAYAESCQKVNPKASEDARSIKALYKKKGKLTSHYLSRIFQFLIDYRDNGSQWDRPQTEQVLGKFQKIALVVQI